jgi:hypothetical protein
VSELKVMIRADKSAPYGLAQRAMNTCAKAGSTRWKSARPVRRMRRSTEAKENDHGRWWKYRRRVRQSPSKST